MTFTAYAQNVITTAFLVYNIDNSGSATQLILQRDSATQALYHGVFGTNNKRPSWYWNGAGQYSTDVTGNLITRWGFTPTQVQIAVNGGAAENTGAPGSTTVGNWTSIAANGFGQDLKGDIAEMVENLGDEDLGRYKM